MNYAICPASDLITQGFGCTSYQSEWIAEWCPSKRYHSGVDLGSTTFQLFRKPVYATRSGTVVAVGNQGDMDWGFWNYLGSQAVCLHTAGVFIIYAHLDEASVKVGDPVQVGQQVGLVGSKGNSTGPHLHVEVRTDGARQNVWDKASAVLDPMPYLNDLPGGNAAEEIISTEEEDMLFRSSEKGPDGNPKVYVIDACGKRHLEGPEYTARIAGGAKLVDIDAGDLAGIPDAPALRTGTVSGTLTIG